MLHVQKRKDRENSYAAYFSYKGQRYSTTTKSIKEADAWYENKLLEIKSCSDIANTNYTFRKYSEIWLNDLNRRDKENSQGTYLNLLKIINDIKIGTRRFGDIKMADIDTFRLRDFQKSIMTADKRVGSGRYCSNTINQIFSLLKQIFKCAYAKDRIIKSDPTIVLERVRRTETTARDSNHKNFSNDELILFMTEAKKSSWYYNLYIVLLNTGLRLGEVGALCYSDATKTELSVNKTVSKDIDGNSFIGDTPKTRSSMRDIPIVENRKEFNNPVGAIQRQKTINLEKFDQGAIVAAKPIFRNRNGGLITSSSVNSDMKRICKKIGIQPRTSHAFRHTFASNALKSDIAAKIVADILGHTDTKITEAIYMHVDKEQKQKAMKRIKAC